MTKPYVFVTNAMRLELLIVIIEFGLSCYLASKILSLPYTNAKGIYRAYREENRVTSLARPLRKKLVFKQFESLFDNSPVDPDVDYESVRRTALKKLFKAFKRGDLTQLQMAKIYDENFDEFVGNPSLSYL